MVGSWSLLESTRPQDDNRKYGGLSFRSPQQINLLDDVDAEGTIGVSEEPGGNFQYSDAPPPFAAFALLVWRFSRSWESRSIDTSLDLDADGTGAGRLPASSRRFRFGSDV